MSGVSTVSALYRGTKGKRVSRDGRKRKKLPTRKNVTLGPPLSSTVAPGLTSPGAIEADILPAVTPSYVDVNGTIFSLQDVLLFVGAGLLTYIVAKKVVAP